MFCISNKRYLHINTGTHGMEDGSTVFWISDETMEWLKDRKNMKTWVEGANKFTNEDMQYIMKNLAKVGETTFFSMTTVTQNTFPEYPEHCDILDAWCYSKFTPRCPEEIRSQFKYFKESHAKFWTKKDKTEKDYIVLNMVQALKNEVKSPKAKTDNVLEIILNGLKMIKMHEKLISTVKAYAMKKYFKNVEDEDYIEGLVSSSIFT
jgi:hypothetical protein